MYRFIEENIHGCRLTSSVVGICPPITKELRAVCSIFEHSQHDFVSLRNERTRSVHHIHMEAGAVQERQVVRLVYCSRDMVSL